ncbi:tetrahydromethanopterin S-methyltransferase subunit A [Candidatus Gottesmanbacteria bacterium]|nr:tetrahydromethanopterin S-methyltransferase subunit A [Candidatus Gottesmanbacteria bacterium]
MNKIKVSHWPVEDGRYKIGNPESPVAVCTEATVEGIDVNLSKVAIIGKCVTENIGIEKVVKNIVSNPNIRFLILCGKKSSGHDVGQTLISLKKNGVDRQMKVIGSSGSIPMVKHLTSDEVRRFQQQIMDVDMQGITESSKINFKVEQCLKSDPGAFTGKPIKIKKLKEGEMIKCVKAVKSGKFVPDPKGSFQISVDHKEGLIICQHFNKNLELDVQINGKEAIAICDTIVRLGLIGKFSGSLSHMANLGRELAKAEIALVHGLEYKQDEPLINKTNKSNNLMRQMRQMKLKEDEFGW